jgi:hypothetical protein
MKGWTTTPLIAEDPSMATFDPWPSTGGREASGRALRIHATSICDVPLGDEAMAGMSPSMGSVGEDSVGKGTMLLSAMVAAVVVVQGKSRGDGASARLKIRHTARRRSLEDEGRHTRKGRGGGTLIRSADLVGPPLWTVGSSRAQGFRAKCPTDFEVGGSSNS